MFISKQRTIRKKVNWRRRRRRRGGGGGGGGGRGNILEKIEPDKNSQSIYITGFSFEIWSMKQNFPLIWILRIMKRWRSGSGQKWNAEAKSGK